MEDFVHLHVHTQYSILDGQASIPKLVDKAIADGMKGIAVTDHSYGITNQNYLFHISRRIHLRISRMLQRDQQQR